jgi:hypothetical protein
MVNAAIASVAGWCASHTNRKAAGMFAAACLRLCQRGNLGSEVKDCASQYGCFSENVQTAISAGSPPSLAAFHRSEMPPGMAAIRRGWRRSGGLSRFRELEENNYPR